MYRKYLHGLVVYIQFYGETEGILQLCKQSEGVSIDFLMAMYNEL